MEVSSNRATALSAIAASIGQHVVDVRSSIRRWWLEALAFTLVVIGVVLFGLFFSRLALLQHQSIETHAIDLGYTDQVLWNTINGRPNRSSILESLPPAEADGSTYRPFHVAPALLALAQLYRWWPGPETLVVLQAWALALGAIPAFLFARQRLGYTVLGAAIAGIYLLAPSLAGAALSEFHAIALAPPLILFGAYLADRRQYLPYAFCAVALLSLQEQMGLVIGIWGLVIAVTHRSPRGLAFGPTLALLSFGWFWYAAGVLIPQAGGPPLRLDDLRWLGNGGNVVAFGIDSASPPLDWSLVTRPETLRYLVGLLQSTGYLAILAPLALLPAIPLLLANLLSSSQVMLSETAHFSVGILPFLLIASVAGLTVLSRLWQRLPRWQAPVWAPNAVVVLLMTWAAWTHHLAISVAPWSSAFREPQVSQHDERLAEFLDRVPAEASISAQSALVPHLSQRERVYLFPYVDDADYVLLDVTTSPFPVSNEELWYQTQLLLKSGAFGVAAAADGYLLLQRGGSVRDLPEAFYSFALAETSDVRYPLLANFGGEVQLLGFDIETGTKRGYETREVTLQTYWRALRKPRSDHQATLSFGRDSLAGDTPTTVWLPMSQWKPGKIMRIAFPALVVDDLSEVQIAVVDPKKPAAEDNRLAISETSLRTLPVDGERALHLLSLHSFLTGPRAKPFTEEELAFSPQMELLASRRNDRSPLCGRPVEDESLVLRRPVLAKIDNAPPARPQSGLTGACLVYEYMAEGGITRFGAFYHTEDLDTVGPIRSARLMDGELGPAYGALVAHVGGSAPVLWFLAQQGVLDIDQFFFSQAYRRSSARPAPHNVYANTATLRQIGQERGWGEASLEGFSFLEDGVEGKQGEPASSISIPYSGVSFAEYRWDAEARGYRRWTARQPHIDALTGEQLLARNVVLLFTESWLGWEIIPDPNVISLRFRLAGEGQAFLFRDGQVFEGKWRREGGKDSVHFVDTTDRPFVMRPGNVWVQVVTQDVVPAWEP